MSMIWFHTLSKFDYAMRVDEDVCLTWLPNDVFLGALTATYAFGLDTIESHAETVETFNPWLAAYMAVTGVEPTMPPLPTNRPATWRSCRCCCYLHC